MVPILGENGRKYNISTKKYNILRPHLFDISWFKRQSLTFMILKYRFNSFRDWFIFIHSTLIVAVGQWLGH